MTPCDEAIDRYNERYRQDGHPAEKNRGSLDICVGCGRLRRSVMDENGQWVWRHPTQALPPLRT